MIATAKLVTKDVRSKVLNASTQCNGERITHRKQIMGTEAFSFFLLFEINNAKRFIKYLANGFFFEH